MSIFAGLSQPQLQANLTAAQTAYQQLITGAKVATANYTQGDGAKSVTYTQAQLGPLTMLIKELQRDLGLIRRVRRPIRFRYP